MSKHTPKPWEWVIENGDIEIRMGDAVESPGDHLTHNSFKYVNMIETYQKEQKEQAIANADLIVAAPELLKELESNVESINLALNYISKMKEYEAFDTDEYNELDELRAHLLGVNIRIEEVIKKARGDNDARINR